MYLCNDCGGEFGVPALFTDEEEDIGVVYCCPICGSDDIIEEEP